MTQWLQLSKEQRMNTLYEVNRQTGLPLQAIEKDWWVTLALKATFQTPYTRSLLFKGGTSLSKSWNLIERFSEDIDFAIDRELLGYSGNPTISQVKKLKKKAREFISNDLKIAIDRELLNFSIPSKTYSLTTAEIGASDIDPQQLILRYDSLLDPLAYIQSEVQIEVSGRSLRERWSNRPIRSFIDSTFPDQPFASPAFEVPTVEPRRTFLEKAFLLHEEFLKPAEKIRSRRMSRHLYDLEVLMDTEHGLAALEDEALYHSIIEHRAVFNRLPGVDYKSHARETISFLPPYTVIGIWESDYNSMRETMFYGNTKSFPAIMERLKELRERFRNVVKRAA